MKVVQLALNAFLDRVMEEALVMSNMCQSGGMLEESGQNSISDHMKTCSGVHCLIGTVHGQHLYKVQPGKEQYYCGPA